MEAASITIVRESREGGGIYMTFFSGENEIGDESLAIALELSAAHCERVGKDILARTVSGK